MRKAIATFLLICSLNTTAYAAEPVILYDMQNYYDMFLECAERYETAPEYIAAIAALESNWGRSYIAQQYNNLFGWRNNDGSWTKFNSIAECIDHCTRCIAARKDNPNFALTYVGYAEDVTKWKSIITDIQTGITQRRQCAIKTKLDKLFNSRSIVNATD